MSTKKLEAIIDSEIQNLTTTAPAKKPFQRTLMKGSSLTSPEGKVWTVSDIYTVFDGENFSPVFTLTSPFEISVSIRQDEMRRRLLNGWEPYRFADDIG